MDLVKIAEEAFACGKEHPEFRSGDTVTVSYRIKEGNKERIQQFRGDVIRISGHGNKKRFTVRKMSGNVGVERIFPIESPFIEEIVVNRRGKVRRAKLYVEADWSPRYAVNSGLLTKIKGFKMRDGGSIWPEHTCLQ